MPEVYPYDFTMVAFELEWSTDVLVGWNVEQRDQIRLAPRLMMNLTSVLTAEEAREAQDVFLHDRSEILIPDPRYSQMLRSISSGVFARHAWRYEIGEQVYFDAGSEFATAEVIGADPNDDLANAILVDYDLTTLPRRTMLMPMWKAIVTDNPAVTPAGGNMVTLTFTVTVADYRNLESFSNLPLDSNLVPVWDERDLRNGQRYGLDFGMDRVDNSSGLITPVPIRERERQRFSISRKGWAFTELFQMEANLHRIAGRCNQFWKPSWLTEFELLSDSNITTTFLDVRAVKGQTLPQTRNLFVKFNDGQLLFLRVVSTSTVTGGYRLSLTAPLPRAVTAASVFQIGTAGLHRLDTDRISFTVEPGFDVAYNAQTIEVFE